MSHISESAGQIEFSRSGQNTDQTVQYTCKSESNNNVDEVIKTTIPSKNERNVDTESKIECSKDNLSSELISENENDGNIVINDLSKSILSDLSTSSEENEHSENRISANVDTKKSETNESVNQETTTENENLITNDLETHKTTTEIVNTTENDSNVDLIDQIEIFRQSDFSADSMRNLQRKDEYCNTFIRYLENEKLPTLQKDARKLLLAPDFCMINDLLFHSRNARSARSRIKKCYQLVLPEIAVKTVLKLYHDSPLGGHSGIQTTIDLIQEQYFFPRLSQKVSEYIRSCHECQSRKTTKVNTKAAIVSFPTPAAPFEVWEIDLYGPVPISPKGNRYIFTAIDLFSKFLYAEPIPNTDNMTVAQILFKLITQFGACKTIVSDQGSEFMGKCFQEVCRLLDIQQEFTPSFTHHCLGACERSHRTLAERMTPYIVKGTHWEDILPAIIFSINNTVHSSLKFSPFEIVFGTRPSFPLSVHTQDSNFTSLPKDCHAYIKAHNEKLKIIRTEVHQNSMQSQLKMTERVNKDRNSELCFKHNDFVYLSKDPTGQGQKFKFKYSGPFVISKVNSPHMYTLRDPKTGKTFSQPIHINRLKPAYVRQTNPAKYFADKVMTNELDKDNDQQVISDETDQVDHANESAAEQQRLASQNTSDVNDRVRSSASEIDIPAPCLNTRSKRIHRKPARFRDENFINPQEIASELSESSNAGILKVKRFLAQKILNENPVYLAHIVGEPAQNSIWLKNEQLGPKARKLLQAKPPPFI